MDLVEVRTLCHVIGISFIDFVREWDIELSRTEAEQARVRSEKP